MAATDHTAGASPAELRRRCPYGDPACPCQDGDPCHYEDQPGSPAMPPPDTYLAGVEAGRADASTFWPMVDEEGYRRGWAAAHNALARRLRHAAREDLAARALLLDLLEDR